ncbi:G-type lectin S-receptor-like serine/threonine-protein kinase SD2-5 [Ananas comosus]|uniref:Receptor-like serine/threonine-protein kinase n=1 Tax=Ananas comosus TaxID=4615 RepID=A0A6P5EX10_ANACO|nr:G-type lectin S-receptor-like serine/threonine-protein kinase SD2-5 [Ananas comosus]
MRLLRRRCLSLLAIASCFLLSFLRPHANPCDYPTAGLSTVWTNNPSILRQSVAFPDGASVRAILLRIDPSGFGPSFACGFFRVASCDAFVFSIFIVHSHDGSFITNSAIASPQVVWTANRDRPVGDNATLQLTETGDLVLRDVDDTLVWSTNTSNKHAAGLNLTEAGNLLLFDRANASVWQSFDHPTDTLVIGQSLSEGMRLTADVSAANYTRSRFYLTVFPDGLRAYVDSDPPQLYYRKGITTVKAGSKPTYVTFTNGSLSVFVSFKQPGKPDITIPLTPAESAQYMRFESDGHLRLYDWSAAGWRMVKDLLEVYPDDCAYPTVCGDYGVCTKGKQCSCPSTDYFRQVNDREAKLGCEPLTPLSCEFSHDHDLLTLNNVSYFNYIDTDATAFRSISEESCRTACLRNCSCKAAFFQFGGGNASDGNCFLPSEIFSLQTNQLAISYYSSSAHVKVQRIPLSPASAPAKSPPPITKDIDAGVPVVVILGVGVSLAFVIIVIVFGVRRWKRAEEDGELFDLVPGMPKRFSYKELKEATGNFSKKLGEGGFGSVFEGKIGDEKIAVKRLDWIGQGKKEFLAEVETIGSIHHLNLVKLVGFCVERTHRLLVYEFMCNGSLDKWIFSANRTPVLDWHTRRKIILDIARGLSYLHEECRQKIAHLDIKPQNILLDKKLNAKVSDFGLSKLIDRDQSQVMTRIRGTPGYLAPEWLTLKITEKVDIYSFGVVIMEIVCGRKNLDYSQPEESVHLISLLQEKVKANRLLDVVDCYDDDIKLNEGEVIEMIKLAMWCLQIDSSVRPPMSTVVRVLEGTVGVETSLAYNFVATSTAMSSKDDTLDSLFVPSASVLSGPR